MNLFRRALALVVALNIALVGGLVPAGARMSYDPNGTGKLSMPGLRQTPTQVAGKLLSVANNRMSSGMSTDMSGGRAAIIVQPFYIGSGDAADVVPSFYNHSPNGEVGSDYTVDWAIVYKDGAAANAFAPVTFSGATTKAVPFGSNDIQADLLSSTALSQPKFNRGDLYWLKFRVTTASTSAKLPRVISVRNGADGGEYRFDPSATTPTMDTSNPSGVSGLTVQAQRFGAVILGHHLGAPDRVFAGIGDSIMAAYTENDLSDASKAIFGWFDRAMIGRAAGALAFINMGLNSETAAHSLQTNLRDAYLKYCTAAVSEYGTNDIGAGSVAAVQGNLQANEKAVWTKLRSAGISFIVRSQLLPRTSSTDAWATEANQTVLADWGAGSNADNLNTFFAAQTGVYGGVDALVDMSALRGTSPYKWKTSTVLTGDGTHPNSPAYRLMQAALLAKVDGPVTTQVVPAAPVFGTVTSDSTSVTAPFTIPGATSAQVRILNGATVVQDWATAASPATFSGLTAGTSYTVQARGVNPVGTGQATSVTATPVATPSWVATLDGKAANMAVDFRSGSQRFFGGSALTDFVTDAGSGGPQTNANGLIVSGRNVSPSSALASLLAAGGDWTIVVEMSAIPASASSQRLLGGQAILFNGVDGNSKPQFLAYNDAFSKTASSISLIGPTSPQRIVLAHGSLAATPAVKEMALSAGGQTTNVTDATAAFNLTIAKIGSSNGSADSIVNEIRSISVFNFRGTNAGLATLSGALTP